MCGILSALNKTTTPWDEQILVDCLNLMEHRGPDGYGYISYNNSDTKYVINGRSKDVFIPEESFGDIKQLFLGHRRLSILDLSELGAQPMVSSAGNILVFNGEIYNFRKLKSELIAQNYGFVGASDSEVLLHGYDFWSDDLSDYLDGMWAYVLFDPIKKRLFCSRDPMGIKPFYYYNSDSYFIISSEIKPILHFCSRMEQKKSFGMNINALVRYLNNGSMSIFGDTFYEGIGLLESGQNLIYDLRTKEIVTKTYWSLNANTRKNQDIHTSIRDKFVDSVKGVMESDVPMGSLLSGGIDSNAILSVAAKEFPFNIQHTFTSANKNRLNDESELASQVSKMFGIKHHIVEINYDNIEEDFRRLIYHLEEPSPSYATLPFWQLMQEVSSNVKVVVDGQGGDELFAGQYFHIPAYLRAMGNPYRQLVEVRHIAHKIGYKNLFMWIASSSQSIRSFMRAYSGVENALTAEVRYYKKMQKDKYSIPPFLDELNKVMYQNLKYTTLPALLMYADKIGMAYSVEARFPFLNREFIDLAFSIHSSKKISKGILKAPLRDALKNYVPGIILSQHKKKGYVNDLPKQFKSNVKFRDYVLNELNYGKEIGILDTKGLDILLKKYDSNLHEGYLFQHIWRLVSISAFARTFNVKL